MAALVSTAPTRVGTASPGNGVASSDMVDISQLGAFGALLEVLNGNASPDAMTISDSGQTQAGTAPGTYAATVNATSNKVFFLSPKQVDQTTGKITITHSVTATVTYKLYPLG